MKMRSPCIFVPSSSPLLLSSSINNNNNHHLWDCLSCRSTHPAIMYQYSSSVRVNERQRANHHQHNRSKETLFPFLPPPLMRVNIIRPLNVLQCTLLHFGSHSSISVLSIVCASPLPFFFYLRLSSRLPLLCACGPHCAHHHHLLPGPIIHPERMLVDQKTPHGVEVFRFFFGV